uniref:Uncharacterized protein n=1 Tax=Janibacter limosus TaxID=53458 RepID=A0AC61U5F1_9MICO|nr:hypothetical protein [Janibacter limosus]
MSDSDPSRGGPVGHRRRGASSAGRPALSTAGAPAPEDFKDLMRRASTLGLGTTGFSSRPTTPTRGR